MAVELQANVSDELTPRVQRLRQRLAPYGKVATEQPYLGDEPFHRAWLAHDGAPFPVRLAHAQAAWRAAVQPVLLPGQLVLGTPPPRTFISYQTGVFSWDFSLDESLPASHPELAEIAYYWRAWRQERPGPALPDGIYAPGMNDVLWTVGISCHSTQDYGLALTGGLNGLRARVAAARGAHPESTDWYDAVLIALDGVAAYIRVHADVVAHAAETAGAAQAAEWRLLAANCRRLADGHAPETFLQAVQLFEFLFMLNGHDSPGRMDQYLWPALRREYAAGTLTPEAAQEIVDCLYLKLEEHVCYGATIGGQLSEGGDATNGLTWLSLHAIHRLRLLSPRTALRWHRDMPEALYLEAVRSIASGATYPAIVNDEVVVPAMIRRGATPAHARDYTFCGCGQVTPAGRAYGGYEDLVLNGAKPLTLALHDGADERSGAQVGPRTGNLDTLDSFAKLEDAAWTQCTHLLALGIDASNGWRRWGAEHVPDFLRSAVTHSCIEQGIDWRAGGADYHEGMVDVVGLTTLADSLTAIKRLVYDERRVSLADLVTALDNDWEGAETLWRACRHEAPKFGNEDADADGTVRRWATRLNEWLFAQRTAFGGPWGMDIIGWSGSVMLGRVTGATPDGRRAGDALADCAGPAQGRDRHGITATLNSALQLPMADAHGPLALSLRLTGDLLRSDDGIEKLAALLRGYLTRGGQHLQVTIATADELRAAKEDPDAHRDLMVRVGGFSAYFVGLEEAFQDDMIRRTEHGV